MNQLFLTILTAGLTTLLATFAVAEDSFDKTLTLQGISFRVQCDNASSAENTLTVTPSGLAIDNAPQVVKVEGFVTEAEVADLNVDGSPEIYVYIRSAGSGSYASLVALAANNKKSLSPITLPKLSEDKKNSEGYMGHDEFRVVESTLVRRFPIYEDGDSNASPSGGIRQLQYKLKQGEATWKLVVDKVVEY